MTPIELLLILLVVILGGIVKGVNGFGYAIISMPILAAMIPAKQALAIMIIPLMAGNAEIIWENKNNEIKNYLKNYRVLYVSLFAGVTVSMAIINYLPVKILEMAVGIIAMFFVFSRVSYLGAYFERFRDRCFRTYEPIIGFFSGIIYGSSNVAITLVTYLKTREMSRKTFATVLAFTVLSISFYRILLASLTGLYTGTGNLLFSLLLAFPAIFSVALGQKLSDKVPEKIIAKISLILVFVVALRLMIG